MKKKKKVNRHLFNNALFDAPDLTDSNVGRGTFPGLRILKS